ncbi:MAG: dihydrodipicolinate synthase family protein [Promethearchaeota archaeon]
MNMIKGIIPPCLTFFDKKGDLDEISFREHVDFLIKNGVNGIFLLGSAGEFAYLSDKERMKILEWGVDQINGKIPVLAGISSPSAKISIKWAKIAENLGVDALISICHPYFPLNMNDVYSYFKTVLDKIKLPFIIYNFPMITNYDINLKILKKLSEKENVIGIKDTTVDFSHIKAIKDEIIRENFNIFIGTDLIYPQALEIGIYNAILGSTNLIPRIHVDLYEAVLRKDKNKIRKNLDYFYKIIKSIITSYPVQYQVFIIKHALSILGREINSIVRIPLSNIKERKLEKLKNDLDFLKEIHEY